MKYKIKCISVFMHLLLSSFLCSVALLEGHTSSVKAATHEDPIEDNMPYYVVIGAFSVEANAHRLIEQAAAQWHYTAQYAFNYKRQLFYVYVLKTLVREEAYGMAVELQSRQDLRKTWVYHGTFGVPSLSSLEDRDHAQDVDPSTRERLNIAAKPTPAQDSLKNPSSLQMSKDASSIVLKAFRWIDQKPVNGTVRALDKQSATMVGVYQTNTPSSLKEIIHNIDNITFVADIFGYRKVIRKFDASDLEKQNSPKEISFELERLKKGDIANLNVTFPDQAAIFSPESAEELNRLTEMMNENKKYKIIIHVHTYFGDKRKLMARGNKGDFFDLSKAVPTSGSGKKLSQMRGELIREYLRSQRIDTQRIQIKPWGDKKPIYGKQSEQFKGNERTEIEITRD
ncbi:OmpA family protein [Chryseolinea soli]|nr:OmpA family protein [Chryseolinea soli]